MVVLADSTDVLVAELAGGLYVVEFVAAADKI